MWLGHGPRLLEISAQCPYSKGYLMGKVKKHWPGVYIQRSLVGVNHSAFVTHHARKGICQQFKALSIDVVIKVSSHNV